MLPKSLVSTVSQAGLRTGLGHREHFNLGNVEERLLMTITVVAFIKLTLIKILPRVDPLGDSF